MLGNGAFSKEEVERLLKSPNILADFFKRSAELGWTVAAEQIRATYWEIETHATRLRRMAKGWQSEGFEMSMTAAKILNDAADELDRLSDGMKPLNQLVGDRWVILWGPSGYQGPRWRCHVGRIAPPTWKFAGKAVRYDGERFTDDGPDATHFSELPTDDPSVL